MRVGIEGKRIPQLSDGGSIGGLERASELGADGVFFRSVLDMSPTLDRGYLRSVRQRADELGLYLEAGLGKCNPYAIPEAPELRRIGDGDTALGFRRMMEACAEIGCTELWSATANRKGSYYGRLSYDRFRTDVSWVDQLAATEKFLKILAPVALDLGVHINLETHEEITSFELVRLVEAVGPDTTGIVFDTANLLQRVEHPVYSARRLAPYVRQTHIKDGCVTACDGGVSFQIRTPGTGMVDLDQILPILAAANPTLNLSLENDEVRDAPLTRTTVVEIYNPLFLQGHPDLSVEEFAAYMEMVDTFARLIASGERATPETVANEPRTIADVSAIIEQSLAHVRAICRARNLPLENAGTKRH